MPLQSDMRYNWLRVRLASIDQAEMEELVLDAWRMCVPKSVAAAYPGQPGLVMKNPRDERPGVRLPRAAASPMAAWPQARRPP